MKKEYVEKRRKRPLFIIAGLAFVALGAYELKIAYFDEYLPEVEFKENAVLVDGEVTELVSQEFKYEHDGDDDDRINYEKLYQTYVISYDLDGQTYSTEMTVRVASIDQSTVTSHEEAVERLSSKLHETGDIVTIAVDKRNPQTVKTEHEYEYSADKFYLLIPAMYIFAGLFMFLL